MTYPSVPLVFVLRCCMEFQAKTTKESTQTVIDDLIPGSRYKFRIKAENDYGIRSGH